MTVQSVHRAVDILAAFSLHRPRLGISELSQELNLPKTTIHGLVQTLVELGLLEQDPATRKYGLGLRLYELGGILAGSLKVNRMGMEPTRRLAQETGQMARLAIWKDEYVLVTFTVITPQQGPILPNLGPRVAAYCTAVGKAVLAFLPDDELARYLDSVKLAAYTPSTIIDPKQLLKHLKQIRKQGYAVDQEEFITGIACISAPIFDNLARVTASISLSGLPSEVLGRGLEATSQRLIRTAEEISMYMGYSPTTV